MSFEILFTRAANDGDWESVAVQLREVVDSQRKLIATLRGKLKRREIPSDELAEKAALYDYLRSECNDLELWVDELPYLVGPDFDDAVKKAKTEDRNEKN